MYKRQIHIATIKQVRTIIVIMLPMESSIKEKRVTINRIQYLVVLKITMDLTTNQIMDLMDLTTNIMGLTTIHITNLMDLTTNLMDQITNI